MRGFLLAVLEWAQGSRKLSGCIVNTWNPATLWRTLDAVYVIGIMEWVGYLNDLYFDWLIWFLRQVFTL